MEPVKGFKDVIGEEALKREAIQKIIVDTFKLYGFEPAETPVIEYEQFVKGNNETDEAVSDIFKLKDRGERNLALRYEFTFQLKRLAKNEKLPYKRYQIGAVFRDEPVSANRFRQFTQCDVDIIGSTIKEDAEILALTKEIFEKLGIKSSIFINNRKLLNEILESLNIPEKNKAQVMREIDKLGKLPEKEIISNLKKYNAEKLISMLKNKKEYFKKFKSFGEIEELEKYCKMYGIKTEFLPSLVRGLSYYNGSIFEIMGSAKESIAGGGSYLINEIQSTGISFGLDRLELISKEEYENKNILIISLNRDKEAITLCNELRNNIIPCTLMYGKISKALEYANSKKIPYTLIMGEKEAKKGKLTLKDMKSGKEELVDVKEIVKKVY